MLKKSLLLATGTLVFFVGLVLFPLPVPLGLPTMIIGLAIMLKASNQVKRKLIRLSKIHPHSQRLWKKTKEFRRRNKHPS